MVDDKLYDDMMVLAGALHIATLKAVLRDLEGWKGREIETTRQALYHRLRMSQADQDINEPGQLLLALAQFVKQSGAAAAGVDDFLAGYADQEWEAAKDRAGRAGKPANN